jgi:hypothetical protein
MTGAGSAHDPDERLCLALGISIGLKDKGAGFRIAQTQMTPIAILFGEWSFMRSTAMKKQMNDEYSEDKAPMVDMELARK